jgi:SsrA-binding protein
MESIINKKAYFNYEIIQTFEAGIILTGPEVKSIKAGRINLDGGYVNIDSHDTPWLINAHIDPYAPSAQIQQNYNPTKSRKMLLHKKEISNLIGKISSRGLTIVPLKIYTKNQIIKIEIGLARGKKIWDKRETIKKREEKKNIDRAMRKKFV